MFFMPRIKILDKALASKIAAGEVVERPESVIKELLENSIDAGASSISVQITEGGKRLMRVTDNGSGISKEDAPLAFLRHATSKISTEDDLERIRTMGFRGEALSSISAVAKVTLRTRRPGDTAGTSVTIEGGSEPVISDDGCPEGTSIEVKDLFYNVPARLKFMRGAESEYGKVLDTFKKIALVNPEKRLSIVHGSGRPLNCVPGSLRQRITDLFGADTGKNLVEVESSDISGFIGKHELSYPTAKNIYTYVNGRWVRDRAINRAILEGYGQLMDPGRYPFAVLDLTVPPEDVDVNIHPTKSEVRFKNPKYIYDLVRYAVKGALSGISSKPFVYDRTQATRSNIAAPQFAGESSGQYSTPSLAKEPKLDFTARFTGGEGTEEETRTPELLGLNIIGQLWGEFLLAETPESDGELYIIDQHGAAERCAFEKLKKRFKAGEIRSQALLLPERFETTPDEKEEIDNAADYLASMGFELMAFGPSLAHGGETFLIKSVPDILSSRSSAALIKDLATELADLSGSGRIEEKLESALMRIACHSVIRGPRHLAREEAASLIKEMSKIDFAGYCPHGRPVIKKIKRSELDSIFKR